MLYQFFSNAKIWCIGKWWPFRFLLVFFGIYLLTEFSELINRWTIFSPVNLGIHEIGHIIFMPFGDTLCTLGGSLTEFLVPLLSTIMFYKQNDYFGIGFSFLWLGTALLSISVYIGDAKYMDLHLVSPFGGRPTHDWNILLNKFNLLNYYEEFQKLFEFFGFISILTFISFGSWLIYNIIILKSSTED